MATESNSIETLLNEHDVAQMTGLSVASVRRWRRLRQGPKYIKIGAAVRYKPEDISAWLAAGLSDFKYINSIPIIDGPAEHSDDCQGIPGKSLPSNPQF